MKNVMVSVLAVFTLAACAKAPESIAPAYVSPILYRDLSCKQLGEETARVQSALAVTSQQQRDARTNDTVGVIFLGLPVSTLSGGNVAQQVAQLKGELDTLQQTMTRKNCSSLVGVSSRASETSIPKQEEALREYPRIAGPVPVEGTQFSEFTEEQIAAYCNQRWEVRTGPSGRSEYNPCLRRDVFQ